MRGLLGAVLALAACASPPSAPAHDENVQAEVRTFLAHYLTTLQGKDTTAVRNLFVDDERFAWFTDGAQSYASPDDVLAGMQRYQGVTFRTELDAIRVVPLGPSLASASSGFRTQLTIPGSDDFEYGGVITWLLERDQTGNGWRVLTGHTSTPGGPPAQTGS